jgi:hypothetical protein
MFDNDNDDEYDSILDRVKDHFDQYKTVYISAGVIALSIGVGIIIGKKIDTHDLPTNVISNSTEAIINNGSLIQNNFQGHLSKIVRCIETGEIWPSIREAAEDLDVKASDISKVINGHSESAGGMHFEVLGVGSRQ